MKIRERLMKMALIDMLNLLNKRIIENNRKCIGEALDISRSNEDCSGDCYNCIALLLNTEVRPYES